MCRASLMTRLINNGGILPLIVASSNKLSRKGVSIAKFSDGLFWAAQLNIFGCGFSIAIFAEKVTCLLVSVAIGMTRSHLYISTWCKYSFSKIHTSEENSIKIVLSRCLLVNVPLILVVK